MPIPLPGQGSSRQIKPYGEEALPPRELDEPEERGIIEADWRYVDDNEAVPEEATPEEEFVEPPPEDDGAPGYWERFQAWRARRDAHRAEQQRRKAELETHKRRAEEIQKAAMLQERRQELADQIIVTGGEAKLALQQEAIAEARGRKELWEERIQESARRKRSKRPVHKATRALGEATVGVLPGIAGGISGGGRGIVKSTALYTGAPKKLGGMSPAGRAVLPPKMSPAQSHMPRVPLTGGLRAPSPLPSRKARGERSPGKNPHYREMGRLRRRLRVL